MPRIDAHQHFWQYDPVKDAWITDQMQVLRQDYEPVAVEALLQQQGFDGCIAVQADQSEKENEYLLGLAAQYAFIKGVVGWIDLQQEQVRSRLTEYKKFERLKGFRHILQGETRRDLMLQPDFLHGIGCLAPLGFTYDLLIFPDQLRFAEELVKGFPEQRFVIDHLAKPYIKFRKMKGWKEDLQQIARHRNVWCKVSGMVTEADWDHWKQEDLVPYIDVAAEAFGTDRIMFGSDWPVCLAAADYRAVTEVAAAYFSDFSAAERALFFGENAIEFYQL